MKLLFTSLQILSAVGLITLILIQSSKGGLGSAFGGGGEFRTKRGAEKIIFRLTIIISVVFLVLTITNLLIR